MSSLGYTVTNYNPYAFANGSQETYNTGGWHYFLYKNDDGSDNKTFKINFNGNQNIAIQYYVFAVGGGGNGGISGKSSKVRYYGGGGSAGGYFQQNITKTGQITFDLNIGGYAKQTTVTVDNKTTWKAKAGGSANSYDGVKIGVGPNGGNGGGWNSEVWVEAETIPEITFDGTIVINPYGVEISRQTNSKLPLYGGKQGDDLSNNTEETFAAPGCGGKGNSIAGSDENSVVNFGGPGLVMIYYYS